MLNKVRFFNHFKGGLVKYQILFSFPLNSPISASWFWDNGQHLPLCSKIDVILNICDVHFLLLDLVQMKVALVWNGSCASLWTSTSFSNYFCLVMFYYLIKIVYALEKLWLSKASWQGKGKEDGRLLDFKSWSYWTCFCHDFKFFVESQRY